MANWILGGCCWVPSIQYGKELMCPDIYGKLDTWRLLLSTLKMCYGVKTTTLIYLLTTWSGPMIGQCLYLNLQNNAKQSGLAFLSNPRFWQIWFLSEEISDFQIQSQLHNIVAEKVTWHSSWKFTICSWKVLTFFLFLHENICCGIH